MGLILVGRSCTYCMSNDSNVDSIGIKPNHTLGPRCFLPQERQNNFPWSHTTSEEKLMIQVCLPQVTEGGSHFSSTMGSLAEAEMLPIISTSLLVGHIETNSKGQGILKVRIIGVSVFDVNSPRILKWYWWNLSINDNYDQWQS